MALPFNKVSQIILAVSFAFGACDRSEVSSSPEVPALGQTTVPALVQTTVDSAVGGNPFLRSAGKPGPGPCLAMNLEATGGSLPARVVISNKCDHAVAVLTSPLEVRIRRTGKEKFVNERMASGAVYAILYVVAEGLDSNDVFRGDGIARDGGLQVRRPPGYTTVAAKGTVSVPLICDINVPAGRYYLPIMTYEASQDEALARNDPFDCKESVAHYNAGAQREIEVHLGSAARPASSRSVLVGLVGAGE